MTAEDLELEFSSRGTWRGRALLLDERASLALIDRAALMGVAIKAIDQVRRADLAGYSTLKGTDSRDDGERSASWDQARSFVRALAGRDLLFEIVLDERAETRVIAARGFLTASDTRTVLFSTLVLVGLVTVYMMVASLL
jgi:hypothetical protein